MINKLYGFLVSDPLSSEFYYRKTNFVPNYVKDRTLLVSQSTELAYAQFCANQLCALVFNSKLKDRLLELDPNNTYAHPTDAVTDETMETVGIPATTGVGVLDTGDVVRWVRKSVSIVFDGATTLTVDGKPYTWNASGSEPIKLDGLTFTLTGPPAASPFIASITFLRKPGRNLLKLLEDLNSQGIEWTTEFDRYRDATVPTTRLAAYVLNALSKA